MTERAFIDAWFSFDSDGRDIRGPEDPGGNCAEYCLPFAQKISFSRDTVFDKIGFKSSDGNAPARVTMLFD